MGRSCVATSTGLVFTGDMRGHFMALDARTGALLWEFRTGSGIIGSPITYELDGKRFVAVPYGGIGGDMTFYYNEPKTGNLWVFALDGETSKTTIAGTNLPTREGGRPKVGEPGSMLGDPVRPGYGFPPTEGKEPIKGEASAATGRAEVPDQPSSAPRSRTSRSTSMWFLRSCGPSASQLATNQVAHQL